jgi:hypothetical protein
VWRWICVGGDGICGGEADTAAGPRVAVMGALEEVMVVVVVIIIVLMLVMQVLQTQLFMVSVAIFLR